jgi:hypothetical protein
MPGAGSFARLTCQPFRLDAAADFSKVRLRRHLESQARAARAVADFELDHKVTELGGQIGAPVLTLRQHQAGDFGEIGDLARQIRRREGDVAEAFRFDHCAPREFTPVASRQAALSLLTF